MSKFWLEGRIPENDDEKARFVLDLFNYSRDCRSEWEDRAKESFRYFNGNPYTEEQKAKMKDKQTPPLKINAVFPLVRGKQAEAMRGLPEIKCYPRGYDDKAISDAMNELVKYVQDENNMAGVQNEVNKDSLITGLGWIKCIFEEEYDEDVPEIQIIERNPFIIYPDPDSERLDLSDADFVIEAQRLPIRKVVKMIPGAADKIGVTGNVEFSMRDTQADIPEDDYGSHGMAKRFGGGEKRDDTVMLYECWVKEYVTSAIYYDPENQQYHPVELNDKGLPVDKAVYEYLDRLIHVKNTNYLIRLIHVADNVLLSDEISPYIHGKFPFVPLFCYTSRVVYEDDSNRYVFGEVDNLKEPQNISNKLFSFGIHNLATAANHLVLYKKDAVDPNVLEKMGSVPGAKIPIDGPGPIDDNIRREAGVPMAADLMIMVDRMRYHLEYITGQFRPQRGEPGGAKSGKQEELLQEKGMVSVEGILLNGRTFRRALGRIITSNVQQFYQNKKMVSVISPDGARKLIDISKLKDLATTRFEVAIADTQGMPTNNIEKWAILVDVIEILQNYLPPKTILGMILDYIPLPIDKDQVLSEMGAENPTNMGTPDGFIDAQTPPVQGGM
jgi:hypothetical protein